MPRIIPVCFIVALTLILSACHCPLHQHTRGPGSCDSCPKMQAAHNMQMGKAGSCCTVVKDGKGMVAGSVRADVLYTCACGDGCDCNSVSTAPGSCRCGKPMAWGHVVKVEGNEALVCNCAEGCNCKQDAADPTKCACGKPLKRVDLSGSGLFFCNCGGSCTCNSLSAEPANCRCGMPLKQR